MLGGGSRGWAGEGRGGRGIRLVEPAAALVGGRAGARARDREGDGFLARDLLRILPRQRACVADAGGGGLQPVGPVPRRVRGALRPGGADAAPRRGGVDQGRDRVHRRGDAFQRGGDGPALGLVGDPAAGGEPGDRGGGAADPARRRGPGAVCAGRRAVADGAAGALPGRAGAGGGHGLLAGAGRLPGAVRGAGDRAADRAEVCTTEGMGSTAPPGGGPLGPRAGGSGSPRNSPPIAPSSASISKAAPRRSRTWRWSCWPAACWSRDIEDAFRDETGRLLLLRTAVSEIAGANPSSASGCRRLLWPAPFPPIPPTHVSNADHRPKPSRRLHRIRVSGRVRLAGEVGDRYPVAGFPRPWR